MTNDQTSAADDVEAASQMAIEIIDAVIDHIAACAAEHELPDKVALAAVMAASVRLACNLLGPEAAARDFRATAERIEAYGARVERLARSAPAGRA